MEVTVDKYKIEVEVLEEKINEVNLKSLTEKISGHFGKSEPDNSYYMGNTLGATLVLREGIYGSGYAQSFIGGVCSFYCWSE